MRLHADRPASLGALPGAYIANADFLAIAGADIIGADHVWGARVSFRQAARIDRRIWNFACGDSLRSCTLTAPCLDREHGDRHRPDLRRDV